MNGARCGFCGRDCYVPRLLPPPNSQSLLLAACPGGADNDLDRTGYTHETALNPLVDADRWLHAAQVAADAGVPVHVHPAVDVAGHERLHVVPEVDCYSFPNPPSRVLVPHRPRFPLCNTLTAPMRTGPATGKPATCLWCVAITERLMPLPVGSG